MIVRSQTGKRVQLFVCATVILAIWGWLLPLLSQTETMRQRVEYFEQQKIDPSAMFYTELEMMEPILRRLESGSSAR